MSDERNPLEVQEDCWQATGAYEDETVDAARLYPQPLSEQEFKELLERAWSVYSVHCGALIREHKYGKPFYKMTDLEYARYMGWIA